MKEGAIPSFRTSRIDIIGVVFKTLGKNHIFYRGDQ